MRVLNSAQMREADRRTIEEIGIPSLVLMENAGRQVVAAMEAMHGELLERQVAVLCGHGNNGGDGFVVARTLMQRGVSVSVFLIGRVADVRGDARINLEILGRLGVTVVEIGDSQAWELHFSEVRDCSLIVDAIFGTGLNAPVSGLIESVIADVNASGITVVSIDLPSGLSADAVEPIGESIEADTTVTLGAPKLPLVLPPGETPRRRHRHRRHRDPGRGHREPRRAAHRAADAQRHARARHAARARQPQGRLRPRAHRRRLARQDRRRASGRGRRAPLGRRAGHGRDAGELPGGRRRDGARVHDRGARRDARDGRDRSRAASSGCSRWRATSSRSVRASARRRPRSDSSRRSSIAPRCRSSSTRMD